MFYQVKEIEHFTSKELVDFYGELVEKYPIILSKMVLIKMTGKDGNSDRQAWRAGTVSR